MPRIKEFYAVTQTSVYRVSEGKNGGPSVKKVFLKGDSSLPVGHSFNVGPGTLVSIGRQIISFIPEGGGQTSFQRKIEMVNTRYWLCNTSFVTALFFTKKEALACVVYKKLKPCDKRWLKQTKLVITAIGDDHKLFPVCHYKEMALIQEK
jgi:hypothetical protein